MLYPLFMELMSDCFYITEVFHNTNNLCSKCLGIHMENSASICLWLFEILFRRRIAAVSGVMTFAPTTRASVSSRLSFPMFPWWLWLYVFIIFTNKTRNLECLIIVYNIKVITVTLVSGLQATATQKVQYDVMEMLRIPKCVKFVSTVNRPNLFYTV